jgi:hypothetical protein
MAPQLLLEILTWSTLQPLWQQDALRRLFVTGEIGPDDLGELTEICTARYGLATAKAIPLDDQHLPIVEAESGAAVSLTQLVHHNGVNALAAGQSVSFGPRLTVVYGENGAGKSGYSRILKTACRSRAVESILGDVLSGAAPLTLL